MTTVPMRRPPEAGVDRLDRPDDLPVLAPAELAAFWDAGAAPVGSLRLLTVQAASALQQLAAGERLTGSVDRVTDGDVAAYSWMSVQLERIGWEIEGSPVWAWARVDFEELARLWPAGALDDIVVLVVDVPAGRALLSAFDPWQELLDEGAEGTPNRRWARCLEIEDFPDSALQATLPFVEAADVVRVCRLRPA